LLQLKVKSVWKIDEAKRLTGKLPRAKAAV
jgi:hypothetical protein